MRLLLSALAAFLLIFGFTLGRASVGPIDTDVPSISAVARAEQGQPITSTTAPSNDVDDLALVDAPDPEPRTELPANYELTWGFDATAPAVDWTKPAIFDEVADPIYGTPIRRLTSADGTRFDRNTYSRRQAENASGELIITYHGAAEYRVTNRSTNEVVSVLPFHPDAEPQWHPTDPNLIRHLSGDDSYTGQLSWFEHDLATGESVVIADLTSRLIEQLPDALYLSDAAEGSPSADGNRVAWMVFDSAEDPIAIVSYDLATDEILGIKTDLRFETGEPNWVSMSASGDFVVAGHLQGTFVYDANGLGNERQINNKADHADLGFDARGRDVYVAIDFSSGPDAGWLTSIDLATGEVTRVFEVYGGANTSVHVSAKGYERPGWVVVSTYSCKNEGAWTCHKVMAVEIATGRVLHLAHTYNCGENYWTETHAVVNQSFSRVYFNSDGGSCGIDAEVYELTLPNFD